MRYPAFLDKWLNKINGLENKPNMSHEYSSQILENFYHPKNAGRFDDPANVIIGTAGTKENGEVVELQIKVENNVIKEAKFLEYGGVVVIAIMSWITDWLKGKTAAQALAITDKDIVDALNVPKIKKHAILLAIEAVKMVVNRTI